MSSSGADRVEKRGSAATVKACDSCRRRKRKCVWTSGAEGCTPCQNINEECSTTHVRKQRAKPQRRNRIAEYESRIQRLESLLQEQTAAQPHVQEQPLQPADQSIPLSTWMDNLRNEVNSTPLQEGPQISLATYEAHLASFEEEMAFAQTSGSSLGYTSPEDSIPRSIDNYEPSADFQEDAAFLQNSSLEELQPLTEADLAPPPFPVETPCDSYLPPPALGTSLMKEFLVDFNTASPLYRPKDIVHHLWICYDGRSDGSAVSWLTAYVVFGISHRLRAASAAAMPQDNDFADYYLSRILRNVSGLFMAPPSLGLIQCLLGAAMLIQTSCNSTPHALFISTALRLAQALAYNDDQAQALEAGQDAEQQRRVFWLAFIKDTDNSILSNSPAAHRRDDIATSEPEDNPEDATGAVTAAEGTWTVNVFSLRVRLALIQAEAIEKVLSVKARTATPNDIRAAITGVIERLQGWRRHELFQKSAEQLMQLLYRSDLIHVLCLEASYFATVFRLRAFITLGMDTRVNPFSIDALNRLAGQKEHPSYEDAKRLLSFLALVPLGDFGFCWMIKIPVITALVTVLAHHLESASSSTPPTSDELREYSRTLQMLTTLSQRSQDAQVQKGRDLCMMLFSKLETGLRVNWLRNITGSENEIQPFHLEQITFGSGPST